MINNNRVRVDAANLLVGVDLVVEEHRDERLVLAVLSEVFGQQTVVLPPEQLERRQQHAPEHFQGATLQSSIQRFQRILHSAYRCI